MHDKLFWHAVAAADYAVPEGESVRALTDELLGYLGSTDLELRDDIAYTVLAHWAMRAVWSPDDFRHVMAHTIANLSRGIGEAGTESVILRSFSALILSIVAYGDWKHPWSTPDEYAQMVDAALTYLADEKDLRGYVPGLGWLHATAHTADVLKFLARNRHADAAALERMLTAIADKLITPVEYVYVHSEDERLSMAVVDIVKRDLLGPEQLGAFVTRLLRVHEMGTTGGLFDVTVHATYMNVKNFLRALYFRLSFAEPPLTGAHDLAQQAFEALKTFTM